MQVHIPRGHQDVRSKHRHNLILDVHTEVISVTRGTFSSSTSSLRPYDSCIEKFTPVRGCPWRPPLARVRLRTCTWSLGRSTCTSVDGPDARMCIIELDGFFCATVDVADPVKLFQMTS